MYGNNSLSWFTPCPSWMRPCRAQAALRSWWCPCLCRQWTVEWRSPGGAVGRPVAAPASPRWPRCGRPETPPLDLWITMSSHVCHAKCPASRRNHAVSCVTACTDSTNIRLCCSSYMLMTSTLKISQDIFHGGGGTPVLTPGANNFTLAYPMRKTTLKRTSLPMSNLSEFVKLYHDVSGRMQQKIFCSFNETLCGMPNDQL